MDMLRERHRDDRHRRRARLRSGIASGLAMAMLLVAGAASGAEERGDPTVASDPPPRSIGAGDGPSRRELRRERMRAWERGGERDLGPGRAAGPGLRRMRREAMQGLVRALPDARPVERLAILRAAARLPLAERRALGERLRRVDELAPDERRALVVELESLLDRADDDVERFERNFDRWERLSEPERERYRAQLRRLRAMPLEERLKLLDEWERERRAAGEGGAVDGDGPAPRDPGRPDPRIDPERRD